MEKKKSQNVLIGAFIFSGIVLVLIFIYFAGKFSFIVGGGYRLFLEYDFVDNLQVGAKVRVSGGPPIGYIGKINFDSGKIVIEALIQGRYRINRGAVFNIYSTSLVGQKYINVSGYRSEQLAGHFTNNEYIVGVTPIGFARTIELAGGAVKTLMGQENADTVGRLKSVFVNTAELIEGLNRMVNDNATDIRKSIGSLSVSLKNTGEIMDRINSTFGNLQSGTKKISDALNKVDENDLNRIVSNMNIVTTELRFLSTELNRLSSDKNSALNLVRDRDFKVRLETTLKNFEDFSKKIKDNPSTLFFGK